MPRTDMFTGLAEFLAVADQGSFRAAAAELGVTPPAVSQAIRALEVRLGLRLFQRTTRSVALTEAGAALLAQLSPAARDIGEALDRLSELRSRPRGVLRLSVPRIALDLAVLDVIQAFRLAYPEVVVELDVSDASIDITANKFDAGIRIGEFIERDMIAIRLTRDLRWIVVGSPDYLTVRGRPASPRDLLHHECIRYRFPSAKTIYRWEFVRGGETYTVEPRGGVTVNDHLSMIDLAIRGVGLAYTNDLVARHALGTGALEEVLKGHLPVKLGLFLYFPAKNQSQPKLRAFIDFAIKHVRDSPVSVLSNTV